MKSPQFDLLVWGECERAPIIARSEVAIYNLCTYSLVSWCTQPMNESLIPQQASLLWLHHLTETLKEFTHLYTLEKN